MIKQEIKNLISKVISTSVDFEVEIPQQESNGDYATNVALILAKKLRKSPLKVAEKVRLKITRLLARKQEKVFEKIEIAEPGFINFFLNPEFLQGKLRDALKQGEKFSKQDKKKKKTAIIDYSSPNLAKPMHVGHLRSTIIGQAFYNIYEFLGYKVVGDNHLGDWGRQFGLMIVACKKKKLKISEIKKLSLKQMMDIYVEFNKKMEKNEKLEEQARKEFKNLEQGDKENNRIWKAFKEKSLKEFNKIYKLLGVKFDLILGESFYKDDCKKVISQAINKKVAIKNPDNSIIINLDKFNLPPYLIQKSDGATLYGTRDLAAVKYRVEKYDPHKIMYVVGNEQSLHFEQLFHAAELLGYISKDKLHHLKFGLVLDENHKKLATRTGRFISAKQLIDKIIKLAEQVIDEKNPKLPKKEKQKAARIIGIGALKYNDLSQNRKTDIVFDWEKMLSFKGNSGPYLQYSYVRLKSILRKSKTVRRFDPKFLIEEEELKIIKELVKFPEAVRQAGEKFQINLLTNYLFNLASSINNFYEQFPVLKAEKEVKYARLALIKAAAIVLNKGLNLLGIETLERM